VFSPSGSRVLEVAESVTHCTGIRVTDPGLKCWRGETRLGIDARRKDAKNRAEIAIEVNWMCRRKKQILKGRMKSGGVSEMLRPRALQIVNDGMDDKGWLGWHRPYQMCLAGQARATTRTSSSQLRRSLRNSPPPPIIPFASSDLNLPLHIRA
jgi:hypothetical protein